MLRTTYSAVHGDFICTRYITEAASRILLAITIHSGFDWQQYVLCYSSGLVGSSLLASSLLASSSAAARAAASVNRTQERSLLAVLTNIIVKRLEDATQYASGIYVSSKRIIVFTTWQILFIFKITGWIIPVKNKYCFMWHWKLYWNNWFLIGSV